MGKRMLVILNRKARHGSSDLRQQLQRLRDGGLELVDESAPNARTISRLIRQHGKSVDGVVIGGGDGTLNAAAAGLYDTQLPLGILPLGTANDLARTLGIPTDLGEAAEVIAAGYTRRIDLGKVNDRFFFNAASMGMSVRITRELSGKLKSRWGPFAYLIAAARALFTSRPFGVEIVHHGKTRRVRTSFVAVRNGRFFGGGLTLHPDDQIDDGLLRLYSLQLKRWWQVIPLLPSLLRGTFADSPTGHSLIGTEFEVHSLRRQRHINTDGEITTRTPAHFTVIHSALSVFAPQLPSQAS